MNGVRILCRSGISIGLLFMMVDRLLDLEEGLEGRMVSWLTPKITGELIRLFLSIRVLLKQHLTVIEILLCSSLALELLIHIGRKLRERGWELGVFFM